MWDDDEGYATDDPKHSDFHSTMSEVWDNRDKTAGYPLHPADPGLAATAADENVVELEDTVTCPDCKTGTITRGDRCVSCGLSWDDLEDAAAFLERTRR